MMKRDGSFAYWWDNQSMIDGRSGLRTGLSAIRKSLTTADGKNIIFRC